MRDFPEFVVRFFFPYLFLLVPLILFFGIGGGVNLVQGGVARGFVMMAVAVLPWVSIFLSFYFLRASTPSDRVRKTFYWVQNLIVLTSVFPFFSTIDGTPVDTIIPAQGSLGEMVARGFWASLPVLLLAQIFVWPWARLQARRWRAWVDPTAAVIDL
ncbi:MAG: hypothetical protein AB7G93_06510 [Bdellovibrionales bacterium]